MGGMMGGSGVGSFGTFGWIGAILNLVIMVGVIIGIVLLVIWFVRRMGQTESATISSRGSALDSLDPQDVLKVRYARGEITREQYQQISTDLK